MRGEIVSQNTLRFRASIQAMEGKSAKLPPRVQEEIDALTHKAELLTGYFQLVAVILAAALCFLTQPGGEGGVPATPLIGLGVLALLTLARLWLSHRRALRPWALGLLAVAETVALVLALWGKMSAAGGIALHNAHYEFIYLLLVLRAARLEAQWVVLAAATAALCWLGIAMFAYSTSEAMGLAVRFGDEAPRLLVTALVAAVAYLTLGRLRRILEQAIEQGQGAEDLARFFDSDVAERIMNGQGDFLPGQGEMRHAVAMFTDLRGFTRACASLSPNALIALLGEYQGLLVPIIHKYGGTIDKFMGDGILASFGATNPSLTYAADALHAADEIMYKSRLWREEREASGLPPVDIGVGMAVGTIIFGVIGDKGRLEYTVLGDTVNLAAKLEKHNKEAGTRGLATLEVLSEAGLQGYVSPTHKPIRPECKVGGVNGAVDLVVIA